MITQSMQDNLRVSPRAKRGLVGIWADRALARRALATFDDAMLKDFGLTRTDRSRECSKPFWRL